MTKHTHTPGPWGFSLSGPSMRDGYSQSFAVFESGAPNLIAGCFSDVRGGNEVAAANARLISAAPEMFKALLAWVESTSSDQETGSMRPVYELAVSAIAKARGT